MGAEPVDVLVIGGGVSGAVVGKRLAEAGVTVLCLEQGYWPDRADYPGSSPEWELRAGKQWSSVPGLRNRPTDYPIDVTASDLGVLNYNGVGGGSVLYNAHWPRMLPGDFSVHTTDNVADDWPIGYHDLQPYYEATDRDFGVSGLGGNPLYPPGADPPLPPLPIGAAALRVARAHARLGWHWWPGANGILSAAHNGRNPCVQRGACGSGCNEGAKASTDVTHWPTVVSLGGCIVTGARVRRVVTDERGLACGAEWVDVDGRDHYQPANVVVCATNGIGTPRLLLASASPTHPDGLANSSGLVGRNIMLHPLVSVSGVFDDDLQGWRAHAGALIHSLEFARSDPSRGFVRGATWALGSSGGPLKAVFAPDGVGRWGSEHHDAFRRRFGRTASWVIIAEDLPDPDNRVTLSDTLVDGSGIPAPVLTYRMAENTRRLMEWNTERARESLEAAGATHIEVTPHQANGHLLGTARMGTDPATSVVDPDCVAHDVRNLVIPDGSVFVTAGSANPTTTIASVALRCADRLLKHRHDIPKPAHGRAFSSPGIPEPISMSAQIVEEPVRLPTARERNRLRALADELIPAGAGMPVAALVGVADAQLDRVLRARPDLGPGLRAALNDPDPLPAHALAAVRYVVAAAYYLAPEVRAALGYNPERVSPVHPFDFPEYLEEGLLDHLLTDGGAHVH